VVKDIQVYGYSQHITDEEEPLALLPLLLCGLRNEIIQGTYNQNKLHRAAVRSTHRNLVNLQQVPRCIVRRTSRGNQIMAKHIKDQIREAEQKAKEKHRKSLERIHDRVISDSRTRETRKLSKGRKRQYKKTAKGK
jgi:hypothetical protein